MKEIIKRYITICFFLSIALFSTTCKKPEAQSLPATLTVNPPQKEVDANQGSFTINVTSTVVTWTSNCDKSWVTIDPSQGTGNATIKANYQANMSASSRTANIIFRGDGLADQTIVVTQLGVVPNVSVTPNNQNVSSASGNTTFALTANTNWTAASDQPWCALTQTNGAGSATLTVNYTANNMTISRVATITLSSTGLPNQTITVTQAQFVPSLSITPSNQNATNGAGSAIFNVAANLTWAASSDQTWCSLTNANGNGNGTFTANYTANNTFANRIANITVTGNGVANQVVTLSQTFVAPSLSASPANQNVVSTAGTTSFSITSNTTWTASSDVSWCTFTSNSANGNGTLTANLAANTTNSSRIATITISAAGTANQVVTVTQGCAIPTNGLVAYYPFNGNANDASGNGYNGTVNGATLATDRKGDVNKAYSFDGVGNYIAIPNNSALVLTGNKTFSLWFKLTTTSINDYAGLITKRNTSSTLPYTYAIGMTQSAGYNTSQRYKMQFLQSSVGTNNYVLTSQKYTDYINQWINLVSTYDQTTGLMNIYFNGVLSNSLNIGNITSVTSSSDLLIGYGGAGAGSAEFYKGLIDDIRIYNRALTDSEIQLLYNE